MKITNELLGRLEVLYAADGPPNAFELKSIYRQADQLASQDAAAANVVKAGLSALQWDKASAFMLMEKAVKLEYTAQTLFNCALTCKFLNEYEESAVYAKKALSVSPNDSKITAEVVAVLFACGKASEALEVMHLGQKRGTEFTDAPLVGAIAEALEELNISEDRLAYEIHSASSVLSNHKVRRRELTWSIQRDPDGGKCLVLSIEFDGDFDDELKFDCLLAERLASEPGWNPSVLGIEFSYRKADALQAA